MDKIEVTQDDKDAAASLMSDVGLFSNVLTAKAVQAFARHRLATRTDATPVAWDDLANAIRMELIFFRDGAVFDAQVKNETDILMQLVRAFVDPPATDVAALVEAAKETNAALERDGDPAFAHLILANKAALAPFTKGQNDE